MKTVILTHGAGGEPITPSTRRLHYWRAGQTVGLSKTYVFGPAKGTEVTDEDGKFLVAGGDAFGGRQFDWSRPAGRRRSPEANPARRTPPEKEPDPTPTPTPQEVTHG